MTVVVTGAAGHVGGNLVRELLAKGRHVRALVHQDRMALEGLDVEIAHGDVRDPVSLARAFEGADTVYHTAAVVSIRADSWSHIDEVNVTGTRNVVEACLRCGVGRVIHFSSIHAIAQEPLDETLDESRPLVTAAHRAPYDRSKAAGERELQKGIAQGLDAVILNPTAILGPHDYRPSHLGQALLALGRGKMPALVRGGFDWVDVRDVVQAAIRAEERAVRDKYVLSGRWASMHELASIVAAIAEVRPPRFTCPIPIAQMGASIITVLARLTGKRPLWTRFALDTILHSNQRISHERATRDLDYHPRPLRVTVNDTLRWFEEAGRLSRP